MNLINIDVGTFKALEIQLVDKVISSLLSSEKLETPTHTVELSKHYYRVIDKNTSEETLFPLTCVSFYKMYEFIGFPKILT